jgi:ornithine cyclodeaminase
MRTLSADDIARLLPMRDAVDVLADAFRAISRREGQYPARMHVAIARGDALVMPGYDGRAHFGVKVATIHPGNLVAGKPGTRATYLLLDAQDGEPLLLCDGTALTALRTGAASGLATRRLARAGATKLALFGVGSQARAQLDAMFAVRAIVDVAVVSRDPERAERFASSARSRYPHARIERADAASAASHADIIVTATNSQVPVLQSSWVKPGTHLNAIGSFRPDMRELDPALLRRARLVVDDRNSALVESGEIIEALQSGHVDVGSIAELGEIGEGARRSDDEITVFKTVGHAALDLFAALRLLQAGRDARLDDR